jgi:serine/threonine-protein kinase
MRDGWRSAGSVLPGSVPSKEAVDIAGHLCDDIANAHAEDIIRRGEKPANVLITEDGVPKLNDFDLAKSETA